MADDGIGLEAGGRGATAYGEAVAVYAAFAVSRLSDYGSSIATWRPKDNAMRSSLGKQAIPMVWDFAEGAPFGGSSSGFVESVNVVARTLDFFPAAPVPGVVRQGDAQTNEHSRLRFVSTDPRTTTTSRTPTCLTSTTSGCDARYAESFPRSLWAWPFPNPRNSSPCPIATVRGRMRRISF